MRFGANAGARAFGAIDHAAAAAPALAASYGASPNRRHGKIRRFRWARSHARFSAGVGLVVGSQRNVNCLLKGQPGEPEEAYTGTMTRVDLDIGVTSGSAIIWAVFADMDNFALLRALESEQRARDAFDPAVKREWEALAFEWHQLAHIIEKSNQQRPGWYRDLGHN